MSSTEPPLPHGWIKEYDSNAQHHFYVDTKASPPRSIWVHPYEDEQFLKEHPEVREKIQGQSSSGGLKPPAEDDSRRRHSFNGQSSSRISTPDQSSSHTTENISEHKKGFLSKLKDKAIGTKEEREAEKRNMALLQERRRQQRLSAQTAYEQQRLQLQEQRLQQQRAYDQQYGRQQYGRQQYYAQQQYASPYGLPQRSRRGFGGGGIGMPLVGGLAGGLLLGNLMGGGFDGGDGGGFGGDGGDFGGDGGGDFGGGGGDFGGGGGDFGGGGD